MGVSAAGKKAVWIVPFGQQDRACSYSLFTQTACEGMGCLLAAVVLIRVEDDVNSSVAVAELPKLKRIEVISH